MTIEEFVHGESKNIEFKVMLPEKPEKYIKTIIASKIRNRTLANVFNQMGLVESWGTGIRRIMDAAERYGLQRPKFQAFDDMFRVNLFRSSFPAPDGIYNDDASEKHRRNIGEGLNSTQQKILELLSADAQLSAAKMAEQIGIAGRNVESNMKKLKEQGILVRHGSPRNGYWEILE